MIRLNVFKIIPIFILIFINFIESYSQELYVNIKKYGTIGDGKTIETAKIQKAIDETSQNGQILYFNDGNYVTGSLFLKNNTHLYIGNKASIIGSSHLIDYPQSFSINSSQIGQPETRFLFFGEDLKNITIEGNGMIDFSGKSSEFVYKHKDTLNRPMGIKMIHCDRVQIKNIYLKNAAIWMQQYLKCTNLIIDNIKVYNHANRENDGLDIDNCQNVIS